MQPGCYNGAVVKAVIFDCDGTLVDSDPAHVLSWQYALRDRGEELPVEAIISFSGMSGITSAVYLAEKFGFDSAEELLREKVAHFHALQKAGHPPIQHTMDFLHRLANEREKLGLRIALASAANKEEILNHLRHHNIEHFFDVILSGESDLGDYSDPEGVNKPKPYIYLHAAKLFNLDPSQCVVIEDSHPGVTAGTAAGCFTIAVPNNYTKHHDLSRAHLTINSFSGMSVDDFFQLISN
jgi:beta-phosphoglucomutase